MNNQPILDSRFVPVVNREDEIKEATIRIDNMLSDVKVEDCVLFYHGVSMVGKTTLLSKIKEEISKKGLVIAWVDFDREQIIDQKIIHNYYDGLDGRLNLIKKIHRDFCRTGEFTSSFNIENSLDIVDIIDKFMAFIRDLYRFNRKHPFAIFFDTLEDAEIENLIWIQEAIIEPLVNEFHTLVVFAGRTAPNTRQRDLIHPLERRLAKSEKRLFHLRPFNDAQTSKQIENIGAKDRLPISAHDLSRQTGGLPGLNDAAIRWLVSDKSVDRLLPHLVNEVIFKRMANKIDEELKAEILALSPMRLFDSGLISKIVKSFWPQRYEDDSLRQIRQLLNKFQDTRLIEPHPDGYGYSIPYDIRLVICQYWKVAEPQKYYRVQILSIDWFLDQVKSDDFVAVTDLIYHLRHLTLGFSEKQFLIMDLMADQTALMKKLDVLSVPELLQNEFLVNLIENTLAELRKKSTRAFDLADQIKRVLEKPEFVEAFDSNMVLLEKLQRSCSLFKEQL